MKTPLVSPNELLLALEAYHRAVENGDLTDHQVQASFEFAESLVPHAGLLGLFFWGEKDRSDDEVVAEALYREQLWIEGGELPVLVREHDLMAAALQVASLGDRFRSYAEERLKDLIPAIQLLTKARSS